MNGGYRDLVAAGKRGRAPVRPKASAAVSSGVKTDSSGAGLSLPAGVAPGLLQWPLSFPREPVMSTIERRYLDTEQAAAYILLSPATLVRMRITGEGPRYAKVGRRVIYAIEDLDAWVEERKQSFTGEAPNP